MKGVLWNSRGLGDLPKHRYLAELAKEERLNFIAQRLVEMSFQMNF
jgi:hypothetical protein